MENKPVLGTAGTTGVIGVVGVIGVGLMGLGMTKRLLAQGYTVLTHDIDPQRQALAAAVGATPVATPKAIGQTANAILIAVLDAEQIAQVMQGVPNALENVTNALENATNDAGLLVGLESNPAAWAEHSPIVLMCSTVAPSDVLNFSQQLTAVGSQPIDAPISGGPAKAQAGTMSMMLAASANALAQALRLTQDLSARQFVVSQQVGDAMRAKLVNNLMAAANLTAAAEAMGLATAMGLDLNVMAKIATASSGQSWIADDRVTRVLNDDLAPRAQLHVLTKDVNLAAQAARDLSVALPLGDQVAGTMQDACNAGLRHEDDSIMFKYWAKRLAF